MASQFQLFTKKRFLPMFCTQFLGAFNDNMFKQALVLMLTFEGAKQMNLPISLLNNLAGLLLILPFFLFSSTAGQIADKYEKSSLTRKIKLLEIVIAIVAAVGFIFKLYYLLFFALFLLGVQSSFFGPIKYAFLPQALKKDELVAGNGLFQMGTSLAILTSMITAGILVKLESHYTWWLSLSVLLIAVFGYLSSLKVPTAKPPKPNLNLNFNIVITSFETIAFIWPYKALFFCLIGISWYWFYGAVLLTQIAEVTKTILYGNEAVVIFILTLFSIGIAIGSVLCKTLTKGQVTLKLMPFGLAGLSIMAFDLYWTLSHINVNHGSEHLLGIKDILSHTDNIRVMLDFLLLGLFGGFYIVPLYAFMQAYAPKSHRARVIAANNISNAFFMVIAAIFAIIVLSVLKLGLPLLFGITGIINIVIGLFVWQKMNKKMHLLTRQDD